MSTKPTFGDYLLKRYPLTFYLREYWPHRGKLLISMILALVKHSPVVLLPVYISYIIDSVIPRKDMVALGLACLGMVSLIVMNMALDPLVWRLYSKVRRDVALQMRAKLCHRIQNMVFSFHDRQSTGRLHSKVMQDVEKLDRIGQVLMDPLGVMAATVVVASVLVVYTEPYFAILLVIFAPIMVIQHRLIHGRVKVEYDNLRLEQEKLNADVNEMLSMLPVTKAHATEEHDFKKVTSRLRQVKRRGIGADWLAHLLMSQLWGVSQFVTIAVVCFGALLVIYDLMTIGQVVMFLSLVGMTLGGLMGIMGQLTVFFEGNAAMESINEIMNEPALEQYDGKPEIGTIKGRIDFENVWFTYPGSEKPVLRNIDLSVKENQTVALVGGSGAGKTTFIKLLLGFYQPIEGDIRIDGLSAWEIDLRSFRRQVGIVTQETFLCKGTVYQNLTHGLKNVTMEDVREVAAQAYALDFIEALDMGFHSEIGDRGVKLSGGQKQRLAIARALLRKPRLLILDEATSALDSESERYVQQALENLMEGRTTFVIAHRLSTVRHADRILVFDEGAVIEDGSHETLIQQRGAYAKLVELQSIA